MVTVDERYCVKTQEEIDAILKEIARTFVYYKRKELMEKAKKQKENAE